MYAIRSYYDVIHGLLKDFARLTAGLFTDGIKRIVNGLLGDAAFAIQHQLVDELGNA